MTHGKASNSFYTVNIESTTLAISTATKAGIKIFAVNIGAITVAIFPATKDVIKLTKISTFPRIFISLQIWKQIEKHVEESVAILMIYTALKLTHGKA